MTVAELAEQLKAMPQDAQVVVYVHDYGLTSSIGPRVRHLDPQQYDVLDDRMVQTEMSVVEIA